jgi:hypothetical protein
MTAASASLPKKMPTYRSSSLDEGADRNGFTSLMRAAAHADDDTVANCIADGVDLFEKDAKVQVKSLSFSKSIILFCELHRAMLEFLIKKCLHCTAQGRTALDWSRLSSNSRKRGTAGLLLEHALESDIIARRRQKLIEMHENELRAVSHATLNLVHTLLATSPTIAV